MKGKDRAPRRSGQMPLWAVAVVAWVQTIEERRRPPVVTWYNGTASWYSSGHTKRDNTSIHISAGTDVFDAQMVLLHELAHWTRENHRRPGIGRRAWHDKRFWAIAFGYYERFGLDLEQCHRREDSYRKKAALA